MFVLGGVKQRPGKRESHGEEFERVKPEFPPEENGRGFGKKRYIY